MAKRRALHKRDPLQLGWKALVAELGVTNATRFIMALSEGEQDYTKLRKQLFAQRRLDDLYAEIKVEVDPARKGPLLDVFLSTGLRPSDVAP